MYTQGTQKKLSQDSEWWGWLTRHDGSVKTFENRIDDGLGTPPVNLTLPTTIPQYAVEGEPPPVSSPSPPCSPWKVFSNVAVAINAELCLRRKLIFDVHAAIADLDRSWLPWPGFTACFNHISNPERADPTAYPDLPQLASAGFRCSRWWHSSHYTCRLLTGILLAEGLLPHYV